MEAKKTLMQRQPSESKDVSGVDGKNVTMAISQCLCQVLIFRVPLYIFGFFRDHNGLWYYRKSTRNLYPDLKNIISAAKQQMLLLDCTEQKEE